MNLITVKDNKFFASKAILLILLAVSIFYFNPSITLAKDDVILPQLTQFNFSPKSIDTTFSSKPVTINIAAFDARSGISSMTVTFSSPSGMQFRSVGQSGGGPASLQLDFPQFSESGAWVITATLMNKAGNKVILSANNIRIAGFLRGSIDYLQVISNPDTDSKDFITAFDFNPKIIDTSFSDQVIKVALTALNDDSDPEYKVRSSAIDFVSPSGQEIQSIGVNGPGPDPRSIVFPKLSEPGIWQVGDITLVYMAGDNAVFATGDLSSSGFPTELLNGNTPSGSNVKVGVGNINITFENVTIGGNTIIATSTEMFDYSSPQANQVASNAENTLPIGFTSGNPPFYFDATTTAAFVAPVKVCANYDQSQFLNQEKNLKLFHLENNRFVDVTTSLDIIKNIICGQAQSLSEFALLMPLNQAACISQYGLNAKLVGNSCVCNVGYAFSNNSFSCVPLNQYCNEALGSNSYAKISGSGGFDARFSDGTCQCNEGYIIVSNKCALKETKKISIQAKERADQNRSPCEAELSFSEQERKECKEYQLYPLQYNWEIYDSNPKKGENVIKSEPIIKKKAIKIAKLKQEVKSTTTLEKANSVKIDKKNNFFYNLIDKFINL